MNALPGLKVGHASDERLKSGVTVFLPDAPVVAAVHISGGAPASRETDLLSPGNSVEHVNAIVLSGGSAFGLASADGVMAWLAERKRGFQVGDFHVPIVPAAALFDLSNGGDKSAFPAGAAASLYGALGRAACEAAEAEASVGTVGAGTGATTADLKGGFGAATSTLTDGGRVAAYVAVNAVGRVTLGTSRHFRAAAFEIGSEFGGLGLPASLPADAAQPVTKRSPSPHANTTLAVIATDVPLTGSAAKRVAITAHDGIALAIFPAHTPFDGDTIFALTTARQPASFNRALLAEVCAAATTTLARAISRAVYSAEAAPNDRFPTWQVRYGIDEP